jgi:hypothetical protein
MRRMVRSVRMGWFLAGLLAASGAWGAPGVSYDETRLAEFRWGIICAEETGRRAPAPETMAGFIEIYGGVPYLGRETTRVPAIPELAFGVIARSRAPSGIAEVTVTVTHPPMGASGVTRQRWVTGITGSQANGSFFRFDLPEERLPGRWTFTGEDASGTLFEVEFEVFDPALMPDEGTPCTGAPPIS